MPYGESPVRMSSLPSSNMDDDSLAPPVIGEYRSLEDNNSELQTPRLPEGEEHKVSTTRSLMNFLRGMIGPGCLALPMAVKKAGTWTGLILIIILGLLNMHCMTLLVDTARLLCIRTGRSALDYGHLAKKVVDFGPERFRAYSKKALYTTNIIIAVLQLGICSVGLVFMATQLQQVLNDFTDKAINLTVIECMCIFLPLLILLNFNKSMNALSVMSTVANLFMIVVFVIIGYAIISEPPVHETLPAYTDAFHVSMAIGAVLYAFEGQAIVLPLENSMKKPEEMLGWNGVLTTGMVVVTCLYAATGFFGYMAYGSHVQASITLSLDSSVINDIAKVLLIISVFVAYAVNQYVIIEMLTPGLHRKFLRPNFEPRGQWLADCAFRVILVLISFILAVSVPDLDLIISIVGITVGTIIAFVLPPFMHIVAHWDVWIDEGKGHFDKWTIILKNIALISVGVFGIVFGLYSNIAERNGSA